MTPNDIRVVRNMADPWDAGLVFLLGFLAGLGAAVLVFVGSSWLL